jgi:hypothetical protein
VYGGEDRRETAAELWAADLLVRGQLAHVGQDASRSKLSTAQTQPGLIKIGHRLALQLISQ